MLRKLITLGSIAFGLSIAQFASAQANPTATAMSNVQIGAGYTYARTDYGQKGDQGYTLFGDYDIGTHWGLEANWHDTGVHTPNHISERSFVFGPRFIVRTGKSKAYGKAVIGLGHINAPLTDTNKIVGNETDFIVGAGGGLEYLVGDHLTLRPIDIEYQRWKFRTGLTPVVFTFGAAYRFR